MKKFLAILLSALLLLSVVPPAAVAVEYTGNYETALNLAKNDLTNLDNVGDAVTMLGRLGSYGFSQNYQLYFQQILALQSEKPDFAKIRLLLELCGDAGDFAADLEERGLPSCSILLIYADAREQEYNGNLEEACAAYRKMSVLDSLKRATELALALASASSAPEPFSPVFGLRDADFAAAARALTKAAAAWTAAAAPKNLSELPLSADEVVRLYRGIREGTAVPERDGQEFRLRCPVDDYLAGSAAEAYAEMYGPNGAWADDLLTQVGTHTYTFSAPNDSRFDTVEEVRASWACDWPDVGGTGWSETLTVSLAFREGEEITVSAVLQLQNCALDIAWVPGASLSGEADGTGISVYIRDRQTGKRLGLEYSMNTGRLISAVDDPAFSAWENASAQPKGHEWGSVKYDWASDFSSCTARRSCGICGFEEIETVSTAAAVTRQPTCAVMGETTYTARFTNSAFQTQEKTLSVQMKGHSYGSPSYTWFGTASVEAKRTCSICGHTETETAKTSSRVTKQATCAGMGSATYTATFKNSAFSTQEKTLSVEKKAHSYGSPSYTWFGTASVEAKRTCRTCGHTETETAKTGSRVTKQATCTDKGSTTYTATFRGAGFTTQTKTVQDVAALGHSWREATATKPKTCSRCGATTGSPLKSDKVIDYLDGRWSENYMNVRTKAGMLMKAWELNTPVQQCTSMKMDLTLSETSGFPYGTWRLYLRDLKGRWSHVDDFEVTKDRNPDGKTVTYTFMFGEPESFNAVLVYGPDGNSYYFYYTAVYYDVHVK